MRTFPNSTYETNFSISLRVALSGELDMLTAPRLESSLAAVARLDMPLQLDLSQLEFMDVAGLHGLERALARARSTSSVEVVPGMKRQVRRLFDLTDSGRLLQAA